jgi:hypothetical protein
MAFYEAIAGGPRPKFSWSFEPDGSIQVSVKTQPSSADARGPHQRKNGQRVDSATAL